MSQTSFEIKRLKIDEKNQLEYDQLYNEKHFTMADMQLANKEADKSRLFMLFLGIAIGSLIGLIILH